jgi:multidrug efflux pump subunit AcrB
MLDFVRRYDEFLRTVPGVRDVLAFSEYPYRHGPSPTHTAFVLMRLTPAGEGRAGRESIIKSIRDRLGEFPDALIRLRDPKAQGALPGGDYAVRLAISDVANLGSADLYSVVVELVRRLRETSGLTDVYAPVLFVSAPPMIERLDHCPMVEITANSAPGTSLAEARTLCEETVRASLSKEFRLTWLSAAP